MSKLTLDRILQSQGFGTRKWCGELIADGEVSIAGNVIRDSRVALETEGLQFSVYGEVWTYREHVYIALNKPANFECSRKASHHPGVLPLAAVTCRRVDTHQLEIVLEQGKYHQVKRMLAAADNHCVALRRSQIGMLKLDELGLAEGEWCYLDAAQLALLKPG